MKKVIDENRDQTIHEAYIQKPDKDVKSTDFSHSGPDLAKWGPWAPSDEGAHKGQNKVRDLPQISKFTETGWEGPSLNI